MKNYCRTALVGAIVAFMAVLSTAYAQVPVDLNPTGDTEMDGAAYEQYKIQYMQEHPDLFRNEGTLAGAERPQTLDENAAGKARRDADQAAAQRQQNEGALVREFQTNKAAMYANDPAGFEAAAKLIDAQKGKNVIEISQAEYQAYPAAKKAHVDANPAMYRVVKSSNQ